MNNPDVADIIAGVLQTSRAHAYELMREALAEQLREPRENLQPASTGSTLVKVAEATELQINWLVAKCEWVQWTFETATVDEIIQDCHYCTDWEQGGPIKEREKIGTNWVVSNYLNLDGCWSAHIPQRNGRIIYAQTELVAAMRCYLISKLGETAEVPSELI